MSEQFAMTFDYAALDPETRIVVAQEDKEFDRSMEDSGRHFVRACQSLQRIHEALRYKRPGFVDYITTKPGLAQSTAYRMLDVAAKFGDQENILIESRDALYLLASSATPESARTEAIDRAMAGEEITRKDVHRIVAAHKQAALELDSPLIDVPDVAFRSYEPPIRAASDEAALVRALATHLTEQGERVTLQVGCAIGIADLVTDRAVYEIKYWLTRTHFVAALGQVLLYREAINPALRAVIVGFSVVNVPLGDLVEYAQQLGVEVLVCNS